MQGAERPAAGREAHEAPGPEAERDGRGEEEGWDQDQHGDACPEEGEGEGAGDGEEEGRGSEGEEQEERGERDGRLREEEALVWERERSWCEWQEGKLG